MTRPRKAVLILLSVLLLLAFFESKRVEVMAARIENPFLRSLALSFAGGSESLKTNLGLAIFFNQERNFWANLKSWPESLTASQKSSSTTGQSPASFRQIEPPYNVLIVGDSFIAEAFGPALERQLLTFNDTKVFRKGVYSTGFSRPDYFNWNDEIAKLVLEKRPNVAFVMFGANDGQDLTWLDKTQKVIHYGDPAWNPAYGKRVAAFLKILEQSGVFVFWVGNPIARDQYYADKMANLDSVYKEVCQAQMNCFYVDTWKTLMAGGKYSAYLPDESGEKRLARASDGIHTTAFGSQIMLKDVMAQISGRIEFTAK